MTTANSSHGDPRPQQYHAEGTCDVATYKAPGRFAAFLAAGDSETRLGVRVIFDEPRLIAQVQGRIITFERHRRLSGEGAGPTWLKTIEPLAQRVHVQTIYALGWPT